MTDKIVTVYKIKDTNTGLFMGKSGGFDKRGKTWESLGMLKLSMNGHGYWAKDSHYRSHNADHVFPDHIKLIEIKIIETEDNMSPLQDFVDLQRRYASLEEKYGGAFRDLVERIEKQGQNNQFQWVLAAKSSYDWNTRTESGPFIEMLEIIKTMKLKQNTDYKKASNSGRGGVVAFANKATAMQVRLAMNGQCQGIDIKDFVETDLDTE